jgi:hypothetical protein
MQHFKEIDDYVTCEINDLSSSAKGSVHKQNVRKQNIWKPQAMEASIEEAPR